MPGCDDIISDPDSTEAMVFWAEALKELVEGGWLARLRGRGVHILMVFFAEYDPDTGPETVLLDDVALCSGSSVKTVRRAIGFLLSSRWIRRSGDGYSLRTPKSTFTYHYKEKQHEVRELDLRFVPPLLKETEFVKEMLSKAMGKDKP